LIIDKEGFVKDSLMAVIIKNNHLTTTPEVKLSRTGGSSGEGSSDGTNIVLVDVTSTSIFVKGSGGLATSKLVFEVRDGQGIPVDVLHKVTVNFNMRGGPGGGEVITPASMVTDANGRVFTTLTSGIKAGALQVIASFAGKQGRVDGAPVPIAIHGGLPDLNHFSIAMEKLNFAGLIYYGLENKITAFVGDKYSNPVPPGTIVQFQSTGGIIGGSAVTDALGRAAVILTSARPEPPPQAGLPAGFAIITAETVDESGTKIRATGSVLFSGYTKPIEVTPTTFSIAPFSSQSFTYKVRDENDNPLVAGTTISVSTDAGTLGGSTGITLKDTQSRGFTQFTFTLKNAEPDSVDKEATVKIEVTSQNGDASTSFTGKLLKKR
jgi:hypothetical protein